MGTHANVGNIPTYHFDFEVLMPKSIFDAPEHKFNVDPIGDDERDRLAPYTLLLRLLRCC